MQKWTIEDRFNNTIYLTEERWEHIQERHDERIGRLDDVLDTIRDGQRRQEVLRNKMKNKPSWLVEHEIVLAHEFLD